MDNEKKQPITEDTVIGSRKITAAEFRKFFKKTLGADYEKYPVVWNVIKVSANHKGKTLKMIIDECHNPSEQKCLEEVLSENRFSFISHSNKAFIMAFDKKMNEMGYDSGSAIPASKAIVYGKTGTKTRTRPACFYLNENGIAWKLYLLKIDAHQQYIENAPTHIKDIFTNDIGICTGCNFIDGKCKYKCTKTYMMDGQLFHKCEFILTNPSEENIPDYVDLLKEFYVGKRK
jgi:hypothetical protein